MKKSTRKETLLQQLKGFLGTFFDKKIKKNHLIRYIAMIVIIFVCMWYISGYWYQIMLIQGGSMNPSYRNLQFVILKKYFSVEDINRENIIVFKCKKLDTNLVKRVVAIPNDLICISNGTLYVNGIIPDLYKKKVFNYVGIIKECIKLKDEQYIVIGDNIDESKDSRYEEVGIVKYEDIIGIVLDNNKRK